MPIYTYLCKTCKKTFDLLIGVQSEKIEKICIFCKGENIERVFKPFRINSGSSSQDFNNTRSSSCNSCSGGNCASCGS